MLNPELPVSIPPEIYPVVVGGLVQLTSQTLLNLVKMPTLVREGIKLLPQAGIYGAAIAYYNAGHNAEAAQMTVMGLTQTMTYFGELIPKILPQKDTLGK